MCTHQYTAVLGRAQPESGEALLAGFPLCSADFLFLPSGHMFAASIHNIISVSTHNLTLASIACESINFPGKCLLHSNLVTQNAFSLHYYTYTMNQYVEYVRNQYVNTYEDFLNYGVWPFKLYNIFPFIRSWCSSGQPEKPAYVVQQQQWDKICTLNNVAVAISSLPSCIASWTIVDSWNIDSGVRVWSITEGMCVPSASHPCQRAHAISMQGCSWKQA